MEERQEPDQLFGQALSTRMLVSRNNRARLEAARRTIEELKGRGQREVTLDLTHSQALAILLVEEPRPPDEHELERETHICKRLAPDGRLIPEDIHHMQRQEGDHQDENAQGRHGPIRLDEDANA